MRVPGVVLADERLLAKIREDQTLEQLANATALPGVVGQALAMPDCHQGYGLPVGGVVATDYETGVISPGAIGFDVNCGVRLLTSGLSEHELLRRQVRLADALYKAIPSGVGVRDGLEVERRDLDALLAGGAAWAVEEGWGEPEDLDSIESGGRLVEADPGEVGKRAKDRGQNQVATLGAGNHFLEVQVVDEVYDAEAAAAMELDKGQVCLLIHSGSRGLGHQVCQDFLEVMADSMPARGIELPDRQLACGPIDSDEGRSYLGAMQAAANFAFANRQGLAHRARAAFKEVFGRDGRLAMVYDVCHNIAKRERHRVGPVERELLVHRKGATRAFPAGHPELPARYRAVGQPVLIPGDMGRYSFVAVGTAGAMADTFGSICHGAGRNLSRNAAKRSLAGVDVAAELKKRGILVRTPTPSGLAEEASVAYKDVANVVDVCERAGIARKVVRLRPRVVIKG
ncbi:MAG TPA: RtcB family protein [Chloroflexota bacterium]